MTPSPTPTTGLQLHPQYTPSDLAYLQAKGYTDDEIRAIWDRDRTEEKAPLHHAPIPDLLSAFRSGQRGSDTRP